MHVRCFIVSKNGRIYAPLVCKISGPKIWSCKFFDKSHVCKQNQVEFELD